MFASRDVLQLIHVLQVVVSLCVTSDAYYDWLVQLASIKLKITSGPISPLHTHHSAVNGRTHVGPCCDYCG